MKLRFWYGMIAQTSSHLWKKCEIFIRNGNEKMTLMRGSLNVSGCAKTLCPFTYCTKVLSPAVDWIHWPLFTSLMTKYWRKYGRSCFVYIIGVIVILSIIVIAGVEGTNARDNKNLAIANRSRVSCAHNTLRASIGINITPWAWNLGWNLGDSRSLETELLDNHTRLSSSRVIWRWILLWPLNVG